MNKCFLFDLDGVIFDTYELIQQSFEYTSSQNKLVLPENYMHSVLGRPLADCLRLFGSKEEELPKLIERYVSFQNDNIARLVRVFPEVRETLDYLKSKGFKIGIVTGRHRASTTQLLSNFELDSYFDAIVTSEEVKNYKPHPDHVTKALELLEAEASKSFMVGDADVDVIAGKTAGVKTIVTAYTAGTSLNHLGPDYVIDAFNELKSLAVD
ncbi:MAG: HAD-IA family hydrolase [Candidatus Micrarchaeota archaeon]